MRYQRVLNGFAAGLALLTLVVGAQAQQSTATDAPEIPVGASSTADHSKFAILQRDFTSGPEATAACLTCHTEADDQMMHSIHFTWKFENPKTGQLLGKRHVINSFCGNVAGNEPRCTSCHAGYGWDDMSNPPPRQSTVGTGWDTTLPRPTPANGQNNAVDCLACHDRSGQYTKAATLAGHPPLNPMPDGLKTITGAKAWAVDLKRAAQSVGPTGRDNCGNCHFYGGGGDNVKHGDLSSVLYDPSKEVDVHMAADGLKFTCSTCHVADQHQWPGSRYDTMATDPHGTGKPGAARTTATCESCHSDYSGEYGFVDTRMYWPIAHMVAPAEKALECKDCHAEDGRLEGLDGFYMPGRNPVSTAGIFGILLVLAALLGGLGHGLLRLVSNKKQGKNHE